jgi:hypothetical protein
MQIDNVNAREGNRCQQAVNAIIELLKLQCQGFILPPSEVKNLLGLPKEDKLWHLNEHVAKLRKELARRYVAMEVNPIQGITVMLYRVTFQSFTPYSLRTLRQ